MTTYILSQTRKTERADYFYDQKQLQPRARKGISLAFSFYLKRGKEMACHKPPPLAAAAAAGSVLTASAICEIAFHPIACPPT